MPVKVSKRGHKFRVVERSGRIAKTSRGHARDGGGHASRTKAVKQVRAINMHLKKK